MSSANDPVNTVADLNEKARQCLKENDTAGALDWFTEALNLLEKPEHAAVKADVLNNVGHVVNSLGRSDDALTAFRGAAVIYEKLDDQVSFGWQLANIGSVLRDREDYAGAVRMYELSLAAFTDAGHQAGRADQFSNLGYAHAMVGNRERAKDFFDQALAIYEQTGDIRKAEQVRQNMTVLG